MNSGRLVPDNLIISMVREWIGELDCAQGALMDEFPRTVAQAEAFDRMLGESFGAKISCVPCIDVPAVLLIERLSGRMMCPNGHVFHQVFNPPAAAPASPPRSRPGPLSSRGSRPTLEMTPRMKPRMTPNHWEKPLRT